MKVLARAHLFLLGCSLTLLVAILWFIQPTPLDRLDFVAYDSMARSAAPAGHSGELVIVEIDEASLRRYGQWPWPRSVLAEILSQIRDAGASVVAFDVVFAEPEQRLAGNSGIDDAPGLASSNKPTGDDVLAHTLGQGRVVLGHYFRFDQTPGSLRCNLKPVSLSSAFLFGEHPSAYASANAVTCSLAQFSGAEVGSGFLNASPDADGILRRVPLLIEYRGQAYPSLALATVLAHWKLRTIQHRQQSDRSEWLRLGEHAIAIEPQGSLLLRYSKDVPPLPRLSAASLPQGLGEVQGKIVLIGGYAAGLQDTTATPLDPKVFGTEIHATAIENILSGRPFHRPPHARLAELLLVVSLGLISAWLCIRFKNGTGPLIVLGLCVATWLTLQRLMDSNGVFVSPMSAMLLCGLNVVLLSLVSLAHQYSRAEVNELKAEAARQFMVSMLTNLAGLRDLETGEHLTRVRRYTSLLAVTLSSHPKFNQQFTAERIALISELAPLHDIGKVGVPDAILRKPGSLTPEEFAIVKLHVEHGRDAVSKARLEATMIDDHVFQIALNIISHHHERWDGAGYPQGLRGEEISLEGRILAIVDVYDALVSDRVYKKAVPHEEALDILRQSRGTHFDPAVVDAFLKVEKLIRNEGQSLTQAALPLDSPEP